MSADLYHQFLCSACVHAIIEIHRLKVSNCSGENVSRKPNISCDTQIGTKPSPENDTSPPCPMNLYIYIYVNSYWSRAHQESTI